ncbi:MAG TPA: sigma-70 family RNA polymerase sigma factor, partial [bacterium]|nr:sigma-70 family RNA polymerase sigma factor [bacterium]
MDDIENIFDRPYGETEIFELFKTWDRITADGKIPRALLNPAEEIISRKSQRLVEKYPGNTKLRQSLDELTKDLREIGIQITGRIRKDYEDYTEDTTSTLTIPEAILEEPVDALSLEWTRGKLAVFLNKKLRRKKWSSSPSSVLSRPSGIQQHIISDTKTGRFTNFMTVDITDFAQEMMETYRILLDPYHNPQARNAISKGLVPVAIFEGTNKGFKASLISHESHYNELRGSILKGQLLIAFRFHGLPPGNFRLKFERIKNAYNDRPEGRAQTKMEKWIRQREDGKILKDLSAVGMKETLLRLAEEEKPLFRFEEIIPFQRDEKGRDWFLLPTGIWIARDLREIVKNIKATYARSSQKLGKRSRDIKIRIVREGDNHGYISWIDTKRSLKDMLGFLNSQADYKSKKAAREAHGLKLVFSIQRETRQHRYHIRRYPLEPFPPYQASRSEVRLPEDATRKKLKNIQRPYYELLKVIESDFPRAVENLPGYGQFYPTHGMHVSDLIVFLKKKVEVENEVFPILDFGSGHASVAYQLAFIGDKARVTAVEINPFLAGIASVLQNGVTESTADSLARAYAGIRAEEDNDDLGVLRARMADKLIPQIRRVHENLVETGIAGKVELRAGDGLNLSFTPYKAIYLSFPHLYEETAETLKKKFVKKAAIELKPGAYVIVLRHDAPKIGMVRVADGLIADLEAAGFERVTEDFFPGDYPVLIFKKAETHDRRSEVRAKGKRGKPPRVEEIGIDRKIEVDKQKLENAMREMPRASKKMTKQERALYEQYEQFLFQNLHAANLTFQERAALRNFLVERNMGLVGDWVRKLKFEEEDAFQNGVIGLMRAISDYDYRRKIKFSTYASWWIKNFIYQTPLTDHIAKLPPGYRVIRKKYFQYEDSLRQRLGREPLIEEIAKAAGVSEKRLISALSWGKPVYSIDASSIDASYDGNDESAAFHEILRKISRSPEEDAEMRETIHQSLSVLDRRSQVVMKLRYGIGTFPHSLIQIAEIFNVERERIRQIQEAALTRIKDANRQSPGRPFSRFYKMKSSEDHADLYLVEERGILPS